VPRLIGGGTDAEPAPIGHISAAFQALRLSRNFGTTPQFWLALQSEYDLRVVRRRAGATVEAKVRPLAG
jgi:plasmid maintenance system antidote protein VapI